MAKEIKIDENKRKALESAVAQIEKAYVLWMLPH